MAPRQPSDEFLIGSEISEEEIELIQSVKVPVFSFPYPAVKNSGEYVDKVVAQAYEWMVRHSIDKLFSFKQWQKFLDQDAPGSALVTYSNAGEKELSLCCKWALWLFSLDDNVDDVQHFYSPETSASLFLDLNLVIMWTFPDDFTLLTTLEEFIAGEQFNEATTLNYVQSNLKEARQHPGSLYDTSTAGPLCQAFGDLWKEMVSTKPKEFCLKFGMVFQTYLIANVQEIRNRKNRAIPSLADYIPLRRESFGSKCAVTLVAFADKVDIPKKLWDSHEMDRLITVNADIVAWQNDVYSFKKETLRGDVHNLVFVISHERGSSYSEAMDVAFKMTMERVKDQERACADLELVTPPEHRFAISRFIETCRRMSAGYEVWYSATTRYKS